MKKGKSEKKITLEIGVNLYRAIVMIANVSYNDEVGNNIKKAFGIDFSKFPELRGKLKVKISKK